MKKKNKTPKKEKAPLEPKEKTNVEIVLEEEKESPKLERPAKDISTDELKSLVEKNIKWSQVIYNQNKKIKHRLTFMVLGSYLRFLLIIAPIILGVIYLPEIIDKVWSYMGSGLGLQGIPLENITGLFGGGGESNINIDPDQLKELLKNFGQ